MLFRVLGPVQVEDHESTVIELRPQARRLLAALLVDAGKVLSVDRAIDSLWGETPPSNPEGSLQALVSRLRSSLGNRDVIVNRSRGYLLRVEPDALDAAVFERLLREARSAMDDGSLVAAEERLSTAEALWRGSAFEDVSFEEFAYVEATRLNQLRLAASTLRFDCQLQLGRHAEAIPDLEALVQRHQLDEQLARLLALAFYRSGRQADALRVLDHLRQTLREELGADPISETDSLYEAILTHDASLTEVAVPTTRPVQTLGLVVAQAGPGPHELEDLQRLNEFLQKSCSAEGRLFSPIDGVVAASFDDVPTAVAAALTSFEEVAADNSLPRIAIGVGEFEINPEEVQGPALHRTLRLMGAVAPGQVVVTDEAARLGIGPLPIGWTLLEGGTLSLPGVTIPEKVMRLAWTGRHFQPLLASGRARLTNLPGQLTTFVGRIDELGKLSRLVDEHRLVTVTGPGGIGKTRLCLQMAADRVGTFPDGVWLVEVAGLSTADRLSSAVLAAARIREPVHGDSIDTLADWIETRQMLLIFDDCERLVEPVALLVDRLLRTAPGLKVLASSREALGVPGESIWTVPLLVPPEDSNSDIARIERNEVVRLFVERATSANPDFRLDDQTAPFVVRICRAVEGIPLAIELAAGQLRRHAIAQVAELVEENIHHIESPYRTVVTRQRTLAATVDWSYSLIDEPAKAVFQQLSVFAGSLDAEATGAICSLSVSEAARLLDQFVDQSLLTVALGARRMLQPIRSCAAELLRSSGDASIAIERHARYFLNEAAEAHDGLRSSGQAGWIERLALHLADIRSSIEWSVQNEPDLAAPAAIGISDYLFLTRSVTEALSLLDTVGRVQGLAETTLNRIELKRAQLLYLDHPVVALPIVEKLASRGLEGAERLHARRVLSSVHFQLGNYETAAETLDDLGEVDDLGDSWLRIDSRVGIASYRFGIQEGDLGASLDEEAYELAVALNMPWHVGLTANNLAWRRGVMEGRTDEALALVEEGLKAAATSDSDYHKAWCLGTQAEVLIAARRNTQAFPVVVEAVHAALRIGAVGKTLDVQLEILAFVLAELRSFEAAARTHGAAHAGDKELSFDMRDNHARTVTTLQEALGADRVAELEEEGRGTAIADLLDRVSAASEAAANEG